MPLPSAQIDLYLQGATAIADTAVASTAAVPVNHAGSLYVGALVQAGAGGPIYSVVSVNSATQVTLQNVNGTTLTILSGTRLIVLTSRPTAYPDAFASGSPIGSTLTADSSGQATAFLPEGTYDYIITDPADTAVALDSASSATISSGTATMTINHTVASGSTALLVAIAWQEPTSTDTLDTVYCGSTPMTHIGSSLFVDLYGLLDPPTGSQTIVATWSGSSTKAAVGEAICVSHSNPDALPGLTRAASGSGTAASVINAGAMPKSLLLAAMGVNTVTGTTTETPLTGVTSLWSASAGTSGAGDRTQANGGSRSSTNGPTNIGWTLGASRAWGILSVEAMPSWLSLVNDARAPTQLGLLATMYASIQAAIDALPSQGGVVHIPGGTYRLETGLVINKPNVTLIGEGATTILTPADPVGSPIDVITVRASEFRASRLKIDGAATTMDLDTGHCGIFFDGDDHTPVAARLVQHCFLENVIVIGNSRYGLLLQDTILLTAINCEVVQNPGGGMRIHGAEQDGVCSTLRFIGCAFSGNGWIGVDIGDDASDYSGMEQISLWGCTMENNQGGTTISGRANIGVNVNANVSIKVEVVSRYFEGPPETSEHDQDGCAQMLRFHNCPNVLVRDCQITGSLSTGASGAAVGAAFINCAYAQAESNVIQGATDYILTLDSGGFGCVEMCNRDLDVSTPPRILLLGAFSLGLSRSALLLPQVDVPGNLPTASSLPTGSALWVQSPGVTTTNLQISDGSEWRTAYNIGLPQYTNVGSLPSASSVSAGTMAWLTTPGLFRSHLQVSDGAST